MITKRVRSTRTITLSLDIDTLHLLKMRGENISALVRDLLKMHLKLAENQDRVQDDKLEGEIMKTRETLRLLELQQKEQQDKIQKEKDEYQRKLDSGEIQEIEWS